MNTMKTMKTKNELLDDLITELATGHSLPGEFDVYECYQAWEAWKYDAGWQRALRMLIHKLVIRENDMRDNDPEAVPVEGLWVASCLANFSKMMDETTRNEL